MMLYDGAVNTKEEAFSRLVVILARTGTKLQQTVAVAGHRQRKLAARFAQLVIQAAVTPGGLFGWSNLKTRGLTVCTKGAG